MDLAPIAFFVYNRPEHTKKSIDSLAKNYWTKDSILYVFSDGPRNEKDSSLINKVREIIKNTDGFKKVKIIESDKNLGLANSIIGGVSEVIKRHGTVIVIEDDLIMARNFLRFTNEALQFYKDNDKVFSITGYNFPPSLMNIPKDYNKDVYFSPRCSSWGWGTWEDRWVKADWELKDFDSFIKDKKQQRLYNYSGDDKTEMLIAQKTGKIDSWAIRWDYAHFKNDAFCVYPVHSFVDNIGFDRSGRHCDDYMGYSHGGKLEEKEYNIKLEPVAKLDKKAMREFRKIFSRGFKYRAKQLIKRIIFYDRLQKKS